jgi:hypothetical protein
MSTLAVGLPVKKRINHEGTKDTKKIFLLLRASFVSFVPSCLILLADDPVSAGVGNSNKLRLLDPASAPPA